MRLLPVALALSALVSVLVVAASPAASTKQRLRAKQAEAQQVLQQVNALDQQFGAAAEAYDGARYRLGLAQKQLAVQKARLRWAEKQRRLAIARLTHRLVVLYSSPDQPTAITILLGANNLSDLVGRLSAAKAVTDSDHELAVHTAAARDAARAAEQRLQATEAQRAAALTQAAAERARIGSLLAQRRSLLSSVQSEVVQLQKQEQREQAILAAQARARLAREQAAAREAAAAAARRREQARRAAALQAAQPTTTVRTPPPATTTQPAQAQTQAPAQQPVTTAQSAPPAAPATTTTAPAPTPAPAPVPSAPSAAGHPEAAQIAMRYLGIRYQWGGASPATGFDCSGLVMYVYAQLGISLPHYAAAQYQMGVPVARADLQPGDLVFFDGLNHVGIYIGGGEMIHAPHTGDVVKIEAISDFGAGYVGARRL
ncbi:MAG TPA: C40 family peptidase [Gaiellaceae bacterium]|nr:C40 family peptidase [Gaiellaceae bacterium]